MHLLKTSMLTNFIILTGAEALALKKGADMAISSTVNQTSVVLPFMEWQSSHIWFSILQLKIRNPQKR